MRVFVAGATGAIGRYLVPALVAAGHQVTGSTCSPAKAGQLTQAGATAAIVDGLDRQGLLTAVKAAEPEVIVHQMTDLPSSTPSSTTTRRRSGSGCPSCPGVSASSRR